MAATKENLLSLGHMTCTERNTFSKQRENRLKKRIINRPMQTDVSTLQSHQHIRAMHLQKRWEELKERELTAQQHNRQLLQQFEEAQDTLRTMLTLTTAMKTIRMEYERYLDESAPRWQQQFKEKTQAAQKKRMEDRLKSCLKTTENPMTKYSADRSLPPPGFTTTPQRISATEKHFSQNSHLDYNQDGSPYLPYMQSSLQTHPPSQAARFPIRASYPSQGSSHALPSVLSPPILSHPFQLHHLTTTPAHHHLWPGQNLPGRASPQSDYPWSWSAGAAGIPSVSEALWGQLYTEEPPPERGVVQGVSVEAELSRALNSKRDRGGGSRSSALSQELDIKPVRLSSGAAESGESSRESSQTSTDKRKKREKRGRSRHTSSERERCSSQESSTASSAVITAAVEAAHSTESDASSEKGRGSTSRRKRRAGLAAGSPRAEEVVKEKIRSNGDDSGSHKEESQSAAEESRSEEAGEQSLDDKSESRREESGSQGEEESASVSIKIENGNADETEKESSSSEEKDDEGEEREKDLGERDEVHDGEEKEDSQRNEQQEERDVEDDEEASDRKNTTDDEDEQLSEDEIELEPEEERNHEEKSDGLKNKDCESEKESAPSSQNEEDEDESEEREKRTEDDEESDEEKGEEEEGEQKIDETEENDSDDSIISPQNKSKKLHIIPEEASEDEEEEDGSETGSGDDAVKDFSDEDIEHLLAPQERSQKKEEKDLQTDEEPEATCDKVEIFQVELDKPTKTDHSSDSEKFDDFYD